MNEPISRNPLDKESHICTGPLTGGIAACNGDSGGPLVAIQEKEDVDSSTDNSVDENDVVEEDVDESADDNTNNYLEDNNNDRDVSEQNKEKRNKDENEYILLGIVSWGAWPCGQTGAPTVYTKVSNYVNFINSYIN